MLAERIFLGLLNTFVQSQGQRQPSAKCNTLGVKAQSRDRFWSSGKNLGSWVSKRGEKEDRTRRLGGAKKLKQNYLSCLALVFMKMSRNR